MLSYLLFLLFNFIATFLVIYGDCYKPRKARFIPMFCKRINRTQPAVEIWVRAFEERDERLIRATKFIYNNNNKQGFTPNGINNELEEFTKESSRKSSRCKIWLGLL